MCPTFARAAKIFWRRCGYIEQGAEQLVQAVVPSLLPAAAETES